MELVSKAFPQVCKHYRVSKQIAFKYMKIMAWSLCPKKVNVSLVQLAKPGTKVKLLGKEFPSSMDFIDSGPMGVHGVIRLCGHCDRGVTAVGHSSGCC